MIFNCIESSVLSNAVLKSWACCHPTSPFPPESVAFSVKVFDPLSSSLLSIMPETVKKNIYSIMQGLKPKVYEFETKRYDMKGNTLSSLISVQHNITVILFFLRKYSHQHAFSSTQINKKNTYRYFNLLSTSPNSTFICNYTLIRELRGTV